MPAPPQQRLKRGPVLPYRLLAGVEPSPTGWLVVAAKLQGVSMFPEPPSVVAMFTEVLERTPGFEFIALHCPIGLAADHAPGGRRCDREARALLGARRGAAVISPPSRSFLDHGADEGLSAVARSLLPRIREVHEEVASYHQRVVFEVHPELGFYQLNGDRPLERPKGTPEGIEERVELLRRRMPGVERVLDNRPPKLHLTTLLDTCADLWTARRIAGRAIVRMPEDPEWNEDGLKMELVR